VSSSSQNKKSHRQSLQAPSLEIQDKVSQLEDLVLSLMSRINATKAADMTSESYGGSSIEESDSITNNKIVPIEEALVSENFGRIRLDSAETSYIGSDHWMAILDGVCYLTPLRGRNMS
jgi:hypothetical protein